MKKLFIVLTAVATAAVLMTSCNNENPKNPPITDDEDVIKLNNFYGEYYGNYLSTNTGFISYFFYNGEIDFELGATAPYDLFATEVFNTLPASFDELEIDLGDYTLDTDYDGSIKKYLEGQFSPADNAHYGTFYKDVDASENAVTYLFNSGTINIKKTGETYTVTAKLSGAIFDPEAADNKYYGEPVTDMQFKYVGKMANIKNKAHVPTETADFTRGQGFYYRKTESGNTAKFLINLDKPLHSENGMLYQAIKIEGYMPIASDPYNITLPTGTYTLDDTNKGAKTFTSGYWQSKEHRAPGGSFYYETASGTGLIRIVFITGGTFTVSVTGHKTYGITYDLTGEDEDGNPVEIFIEDDRETNQMTSEGYMLFTVIEDHQSYASQPTEAEFEFHGKHGDNSYGNLILRRMQEEFEMDYINFRIYTNELDNNSTTIKLPTGDFTVSDSGDNLTFYPGKYDVVDGLRPSNFKKLLEVDPTEYQAMATLSGGTLNISYNESTDEYTITMNITGKNQRGEVPMDLTGSYTGKVTMIDKRD